MANQKVSGSVSTSRYYSRGNTYFELQQYEMALVDYGRAIEVDAHFAPAYHGRGNTYKALQQPEAALADFGRALKADPNFAPGYGGVGAILGNQGKFREALPYFEQAAQLGDSLGAQYAAQVRQTLGLESTPQVNPAQAAFEAFQQAASPAAMRQAVAQFSFMTQLDFIATTEQIIAQQVRAEHRPHLEQRLNWLRQIAKEQTQ